MDHDGLEVLAAHHRSCPQPAEMAVGVGGDACHGRSVLARRADAQDGPVPGAGTWLRSILPSLHIHSPEVVDLLQLESREPTAKPEGTCPARNNQGVKIGKVEATRAERPPPWLSAY